jgi:uncharacterized protein YprB with RNaseH-like and TPR domain
MLSDDFRARLARLHSAAHRAATDGPRPAGLGERPTDEPAAHGEECENASGKHLKFRRCVSQYWPGAERAVASLHGDGACFTNGMLHAELAAAGRWFGRATLFLDLETCGFAGSMVFLAGLAWHDQGRLVIDQLLARNYAEERSVLEALWQIVARNRVLVTFNGKSFDWPMVRDRSTRHHLGSDVRGEHAATISTWAGRRRLAGDSDSQSELVHCDLLHHARRRWKHVLPNCRLQTLERYVCRRSRRHDLSGALVPAAYHEFVRSGETGRVAAILQHNALDLATLAQLAFRLITDQRPAGSAALRRA